MKRSLWLSFAVLACIACPRIAHAQFPHLNGKLVAKSVAIRKVVVLPVQIAFTRQGARGSESMTAEAGQVGASLYSAVSAELARRGIQVLPNGAEQSTDDAAKYALADLQARYDNVAVQVRRKPGRVEKGSFTLGDRVARFEPGAAADALVFIRGAGLVRTPARKAISLAMWGLGGLLAQFHGEVVLVDARTGEVLAFLRFNRLSDMTQKSDERFTHTMREALHDVPLPLPPPKS